MLLTTQDEIQSRFQAQIQVLQSELDQRDRLIADLQNRLHRRQSPATNDADGVAAIRLLSQSTSTDGEDETDGTLGYFAVSFFFPHNFLRSNFCLRNGRGRSPDVITIEPQQSAVLFSHIDDPISFSRIASIRGLVRGIPSSACHRPVRLPSAAPGGAAVNNSSWAARLSTRC